jgi:hypothetical protein
VFYVTGADGGLLDQETCRRVADALVLALDRREVSRT